MDLSSAAALPVAKPDMLLLYILVPGLLYYYAKRQLCDEGITADWVLEGAQAMLFGVIS